ncbi:MAG: TIGR03663 family protein [Methanocorpusculum sp.]|nr:TIGR03663 family protein [Methanocorpusculum sp.]MDE2522539.1 TIGR03663 family protein [Methanocorpusculum sp.]MDE2524500.1 TIGR03663 family protein [Methanocorpusculum sp.]
MPAPTFLSHIQSRVRVEHVFFAILIVALILRFAFLDLKLFHHDEAIHAWFSYQLLTQGTYIYDPVYHGPFLYYVTAGMFALFGDSDLVGRILPCIFGTALIPLVYCLYRMGYLSGKTAIIAGIFVAIAPEMIYFSRFLRNDVFVVFFSLLIVVAFLAWIQKGKWYYLLLAGIAAALGMCSKENMPIILVTFGLFFLYLVWSRKITLPERWLRDVIFAVAVFFGVIFLFYSSFGVHPEVILTAGPSAIEHWLNMHNQQRIGGPPYYYLLLFVLYELPVLLFAIAGVILYLRRPCGKKQVMTEEILPEISDAAFFESPEEPVSGPAPPAPVPEKKNSIRDLFRRPEPPVALNRQEEFIRFAIYWTIMACLTYAYIGEKVPWLSLHQLVPMIFVAAYALSFAGKYTKPLMVLACAFLLVVTFHVAYTPADIAEPIVQVQNSEDLVELMAAIDASEKVAISSDQGWPFTWYYRGDGWDKISYYGRKISEDSVLAGDFDIIMTHDDDSYESLPGYEKKTIRLSYWIDGAATGTDPGWLWYYVTRDGKIGSINTDVFTRISS